MSNSDAASRGEYLCRLLNTGSARLHFSGVRGISMSALAQFLAKKGHRVSGSDAATGGKDLGEVVVTEQPGGYIRAADALIYSLAIGESDGERLLARLHGVPEYSRPELLGAIMRQYKNRIGISGTHGKSTTTAILAHVFSHAGLSPTVFSGVELAVGDSYVVGGSENFIYEACEYKRAFLHFSPDYAIITGVELDHTDCYPDLNSLIEAFISAHKVARRVVISTDFAASSVMVRALGKSVVTFGTASDADYVYSVTSADRLGSDFVINHRGKSLGLFHISVMGAHNVANATAAIALSLEYDIDVDIIRSALHGFRGIGRRLEHIGTLSGREVYYDYAHHPTELRAAISTLRGAFGRVSVIFRPHTYTRTRDLWRGFVDALCEADYAVISRVFAAREKEIPDVNSARLAAEIPHAVALDGSEAVEYILSHTDGAIAIIGAGDLTDVKETIEDLIKQEKDK